MGLGGIGIWELVVLLVIVMVLFGTKKLRNIGEDLGGAIKGFRKAMRDGENEEVVKNQTITPDQKTIDAQAASVSTPKETQRTS
jgi:sec-independent protein translocase protein TatA